MKVLLDTCTFLWIAATPEALSAQARALFQDADNEVYLSAASPGRSQPNTHSAGCRCRSRPSV